MKGNPKIGKRKRQKYRIRLIDNRYSDHILKEMKAINVDPEGIQIMLPKSDGLVLKISSLKSVAANILKQQMLSIGGDCAVSRDTLTDSRASGDVLIMGDRRHYSVLVQKLKRQKYFNLPELADEIERFISRFNGGKRFRCRGKVFDLSDRTLVMGILNVTPDSFSDGGKYDSVDSAVEAALKMEEEGADIVDIGGESTRPGSEPVPFEEELKRVIPVIEGIRKHSDVVISVDTYKSAVAEEALNRGANIVNDISGFHFDPRMPEVVKKYDAGVILMHIKGTPKDMQKDPVYRHIIDEICEYLTESVNMAEECGINRENIVIDPGIGFGKKFEDNYLLIRYLREFKSLGYPVLVGPSRKSFIGNLLNLPVGERLEGTISAVCCAIMNGVDIVRVHDVKEVKRAVKVADAIVGKNTKIGGTL